MADVLPMKQASVPEQPTDDVLSEIHVLANLIGQGFSGYLETEQGLTVAEWRVMLALGRHPGQTATDITERWAMDKMAISRALQRLESAGHIRRDRNQQDRRSYRLSLTEDGKILHDRILPGATARYRDFMSCLNAQEISQLRNALHKLIDHAKETTKWP
jgi:DNA-binding MarR family transcriptional regulator